MRDFEEITITEKLELIHELLNDLDSLFFYGNMSKSDEEDVNSVIELVKKEIKEHKKVLRRWDYELSTITF